MSDIDDIVDGFKAGWEAAREKIVYCKDCKYYKMTECCHYYPLINARSYDFCSRGERRKKK